jgi:hypothetical protein
MGRREQEDKPTQNRDGAMEHVPEMVETSDAASRD